MSLYDVSVAGFNFWGILFVLVLTAIFIFGLYWLWNCPCRDEEDCCDRNTVCTQRQVNILPQQKVVPLYALEIEPGIVVLQSADGEIFRVLREYDSVGRTGSGSPPLSKTVSSNASVSYDHHYMPSFTRAHYQTRPTAPLLPNYEDVERELDTSDPFGDGAFWTPLKTLN